MQLIHGDCLEKMKNIPDNSIDLVLTDPPYSLGYDFENDDLTDSEQASFMEKYVSVFYEKLKHGGVLAIFMKQELSHHLYFIAKNAGFTWQNSIIWNRDGGQMPITKFGICHEPITVFTKGEFPNTFNLDLLRVKSKYADSDKRLNPLGKNPGDVWYVPALFGKKAERIKGIDGKAAHPTQKPIGIVYPFIEAYTKERDTVLDAFMGTGTTGFCSVAMNRNFIGIEKDDKYFEIAEKRIEEHLTTAST
ncbi:MAG: DNA methyltransferase [Candidatus Cloacimonadaceae bacterium]